MTSRIQNAASQPDVTNGVQHLHKAIYSGGVPQEVLELVHLRASQINGCSACSDAGVQSAAKAGVSNEKLLNVATWYENPIFGDAERAALAPARRVPPPRPSTLASGTAWNGMDRH
jgi:AhpD family alkylhydroperoxidase